MSNPRAGKNMTDREDRGSVNIWQGFRRVVVPAFEKRECRRDGCTELTTSKLCPVCQEKVNKMNSDIAQRDGTRDLLFKHSGDFK